MKDTRKFGQAGEELAKKYLQKNNYNILASNHKVGRLEIDIIARDGKQTVFIEVKTRRETASSHGENPLTSRQAGNLKRAICAYCLKNRLNLEAVRLDLIIIRSRNSGEVILNHYRDIF